MTGLEPARWTELAGIIQRLAGTRAIDEVVSVARETARRLTGADGIAFILRESGFCHYVAEDAAAPLWLGQRFPVSSCVSGWAMEHGRTAVVPDVYADDRVPHEAYRSTFVKSMVVVPVAGEPGERAVAAIGAYWAALRHPQPDEISVLEALARSSATAIANVRLLETLRASDALQRAIVEATPECIKIVAEDGRLIQMNPAGLSMIEASDAASVHHACTYDLIASEHRDQWREAHKQVCAGERLNWEFDIVGLGGTRRRMESHAVPLKLPDGTYAQLAVTRDVTQRKRAEEALRLERDRSRAVLDNLGDGYVLVDSGFRVLEINPAGLAIDERPIEEIVGKTFWEAWPGVENASPGRLWKEAMSERQPRSLEHCYVWPGGRSAWLEVHTFPVDSGLAFFFRDVSGKKAAEAALAEREAHLSAIFAQAAAGISETDPSGRFLRVNDRFCAISGRSREDLLSLRMHDITHPDDLPGNAPLFDRAATAGEPFEIEKRYVRADGAVVWVHNSVTMLREDDGRLRNIVCVTIDINDRKAAEERLQALNDTLEEQVAVRSAERDRLWTLSQDMFARADYSGMMSAVSPAWTQILGWSETELLEQPYATFMHPDDILPTLEAIGRMAQTSEPTHFTNRIATKDGSWKHIEWTVAPDPDGENFVAVGRDVSTAKVREAELEAAQEALRQSQKMEAMGQLTGGVAHDFNNLLTPIIGSLDMLVRKSVGSERERRLIDGALQSAERAKTLVQRLLAFARRQPLQPGPVDVNRVVRGMEELIASTSGPNIKVRIDLPIDLPPAKADANQLEMAILNLAVNARDAMPEGGTLTLTARRKSVHLGHSSKLPPGHYVRLAVADTGTGMDKTTLARAVEPFFSTKGIGKGTGLGLSMVHGLAAQLGGGMIIRSAPGQGTAVELWLPISAVPANGAEDNLNSARRWIGRGTALLVDDEELVRMSTADMLKDMGFDVVEAGSAEQALRLITADTNPSVLVTDHLMPGMSGADLAREARALNPTLPVLIVSGYAEVGGIAPDLPCLTKPFRRADLEASLSELLNARR